MTEPNAGTPAEKVRSYPCPGCGAQLVFEPRGGSLSCPYCGRAEPIPQSASEVREQSYEEYLRVRPERLAQPVEGGLDVKCPDCGATVTFPGNQTAGDCPFCGTSLVTAPRSAEPWVAPEGVLPFGNTKQQATGAIRQWLTTRWLAPNALKRIARQEKLQGVYLPFWTFDAHTVSHYDGARGEHYWEMETHTDGRGRRGTRRVMRTRWYPASGTVERWFDDVAVPATESLPRVRLTALEPWDFAATKPYDPAFLSGFKAQRYQLDTAAGFEEAKGIMGETILLDARRDIGGDEQRVNDVKTSYSAITYKYLLLPVWISAYRFRDKVYQVMVNARTGEVQGDRPYSPWKVAAVILLALLAAGAFAILSQR
jgi:ribosomal protein S27E